MQIEARADEFNQFLCQACDEAFFHLTHEEPFCPKCGKKGSEWLQQLPSQKEEDEATTVGTAPASDG